MYLILFSCGICNRQYSCLGGGVRKAQNKATAKKKKKKFLSSVRCFLWAFSDFPIKVALNQSQAFFHVDNYLKMWCSGQQFIATHFLSVISPLAATGRKGGSGKGRPLGGTVAPRRAAPGSPRTGQAQHKRWPFQGVRGECLHKFPSNVESSFPGISPRWRSISDPGRFSAHGSGVGPTSLRSSSAWKNRLHMSPGWQPLRHHLED